MKGFAMSQSGMSGQGSGPGIQQWPAQPNPQGQYPAAGAYPPPGYPQQGPPMPVGYASGGYAMPAKKPQNPAKGYTTVSIIYGLLGLAGIFFTYWMMSGVAQVRQILQDAGIYEYAYYGLFIRAAVILGMLIAVSGLTTLKPWSRPVLGIYAALMLVLQAVDMYITYQAGKNDERFQISAQIMIGYILGIGHVIWTIGVVVDGGIKRAIEQEQKRAR
jgi:hypothetical protein